jgi:hypothetical protein
MLRTAFRCGMDSRAESLPAIMAKLNLVGVNLLRVLGLHPIILSQENRRGERDSRRAFRYPRSEYHV